ncbi:hypothetical protein AABM06_03450 [Listeria ivanovii]|uniref:hypothetical protein n=1 Tax=Listeria ivanovii TaxID=1638 RepID=UPI00162AB0FC|nr:hypothetical protein [Listeria ivanovii]MBC1758728.1 hypothetical protein [Listeria ivanovii]
MNHINRLLIRLKETQYKSGYKFAVGFVNYDKETGKYIAKPQPWDGKPGTGTEAVNLPEWWHSDYTTEEEASEALHRLFEGYGIPEEDCVIFLMHYLDADMGE